MMKWNSRVAIYKFSLICAYCVFLIFVLAFSIPIWFGVDEQIMGLWAGGKGDSGYIDDVEETGFGEGFLKVQGQDAEDWLEAVRGLWVAAMAFYLFGVVGSLVENCCMSLSSKDYGISGFLILFAGLCGSAGVITTAIEVEDEDDWEPDYLWGYIIAVLASGLAIILAIVLLISKNYGISDDVKNSRTADYVYAHNKQQRPYAPEYNNPGYRGDELPLVNGVPFHQPYGHSPYSMYRTGHENGFAGSKYDQGPGYNPYGYKDPRPGNRTSVAESADLSNGYTQDIVHAEHSLGRRGDYGGGRSQHNRGDYFYNGSSRPY